MSDSQKESAGTGERNGESGDVFAARLDVAETASVPKKRLTEDWLAIVLGLAILVVSLLYMAVASYRPEWFGAGNAEQWIGIGKGFFGKFAKWGADPSEAVTSWGGLSRALGFIAAVALIAGRLLGRRGFGLLPGVLAISFLACFAYVLSSQEVIKHYNLEYPLWALLVGLIISNTVGTPKWLFAASMSEFYIKIGLVFLGAEILFGELLALGLPGVCIAWIVTPIVLISTFWFGQKVLKIESPSLNMVISADMSVCGVSAAIATGAACRAKKEELSLAIGLSLSFTVVMMVVLPQVCNAIGLSEVLAGAWIGGTIDSTGAVAAAGEFVGPTALKVAGTVKMIQNILIGVVAFFVAAYWVAFVERDSKSEPSVNGGEIWKRFPKFILGFVAASILFSALAAGGFAETVTAPATSVTKGLRGWFFCMAFVCIGLETHFATLFRHLGNGRPLVLYLVGQTLNLALTLFMAWLVFEVIFPGASEALLGLPQE